MSGYQHTWTESTIPTSITWAGTTTAQQPFFDDFSGRTWNSANTLTYKQPSSRLEVARAELAKLRGPDRAVSERCPSVLFGVMWVLPPRRTVAERGVVGWIRRGTRRPL